MQAALTLLHALLPELDSYAQTTETPSLADFAGWLHQRFAPPDAGPDDVPPHREPAYLNGLAPTMQLGPLVTRLNYFAHAHAQQQLADLPVTNIRDFSVLAAISSGREPTKSKIAAATLLELSTITEVTRRLTQAGLIIETTDPKDRRARRLQATPAGQQVFAEANARMEQMVLHIYGPLSAAERAALRRTLSRLNAIHSPTSPA